MEKVPLEEPWPRNGWLVFEDFPKKPQPNRGSLLQTERTHVGCLGFFLKNLDFPLGGGFAFDATKGK